MVFAAAPVPVRINPGTTRVRPDVGGISIFMFWSGAVVPPYSTVNVTGPVEEL